MGKRPEPRLEDSSSALLVSWGEGEGGGQKKEEESQSGVGGELRRVWREGVVVREGMKDGGQGDRNTEEGDTKEREERWGQERIWRTVVRGHGHGDQKEREGGHGRRGGAGRRCRKGQGRGSASAFSLGAPEAGGSRVIGLSYARCSCHSRSHLGIS